MRDYKHMENVIRPRRKTGNKINSVFESYYSFHQQRRLLSVFVFECSGK